MKDLFLQNRNKNFTIECRDGEIEMTGNSILTDPVAFFSPVQEWANEYTKNYDGKTVINLRFDYIDSASVQSLFELLKIFTEKPDYKSKVNVKWYFELDDPELLEIGEIIESRLKLNFDYIEYNDK